MKVVCAWCQQAGHFEVLGEKEPPGDDVSHGICEKHALVFMAEARRQRKARSSAEPVGPGRPIRTNGRSGVSIREREVGNVAAGRLLVIVSRDSPGRFAYLNHLYGSDVVEVIVDRRMGERRWHRQFAVDERRWLTRRRRDVTEELDTFGWSLVRR